MRKIRVLIVDDSAVVRMVLTKVVSEDPRFEVMGTAADPFIAADKMRKEAPDVITLDIEMPRMDGLTFLKKIMEQHPIPVVIFSGHTAKGTEAALKALEYGAVEIIAKPEKGDQATLAESRAAICTSIYAAAMARLRRHPPKIDVPPKLTADAVIPRGPRRESSGPLEPTEKVVVVGASTGGTEALRVFLGAMPTDAPGIVVVQHMPEKFTSAFAKRLNDICSVEVKEADDGDAVLRGRALIAPGNRHTLLKRTGGRYHVEVKDGPLVCRHRPSVDVLFRSAARYAGGNAVGVIMTGMGDDGASGMAEMKEAGAFNIAQDDATSVVFGMPKEAISRGAVDVVLPLQRIPDAVVEACKTEAEDNDGGRRKRNA